MPFATRLKLGFLACAAVVQTLRPDGSAELYGGLAALALAASLVGLFLRRRFAAGQWLCLALVAAAVALRIALTPEPVAPPAAWPSVRPATPEYARSIRVRVRIRETLKPGFYLVDYTPLFFETRERRRSAAARERLRPARSEFTSRSAASGASVAPPPKLREIGRSAAHSDRAASDAPTVRRRYRPRRTFEPARHRFEASAESYALLAAPDFIGALQINDYELDPGCVLELRLSGRAAPERPGDSGFDRYLLRKQAQTRVRASVRHHLLHRDCRALDLRGRFQYEIRERLQRYGRPERAELGAALGFLLGRAGYMDRELKREAAQLGILHLFAASGLHLAIFYACLLAPLARLFGRRHPAALLPGLLPCFAYLYLLGFPVSLLRAFLFICLHALKSLLHRRMGARETLLNAGVGTLLITPEEFASLASVLSFGAVAGILYYNEAIQSKTLWAGRAGLRWLSGQLSITIAASLFTIPVLIVAFQAHAWFSLPANLLLVPLTGLLLPLLVVCLCVSFAPLPPEILELSFYPAMRLLEVFTGLTRLLAAYDFSSPALGLWAPFAANTTLWLALIVLTSRRFGLRARLHARRVARFSVLALGPLGAAAGLYLLR